VSSHDFDPFFVICVAFDARRVFPGLAVSVPWGEEHGEAATEITEMASAAMISAMRWTRFTSVLDTKSQIGDGDGSGCP